MPCPVLLFGSGSKGRNGEKGVLAEIPLCEGNMCCVERKKRLLGAYRRGRRWLTTGAYVKESREMRP